MNKQANIERLELLADKLEAYEFAVPTKFDLNFWIMNDDGHRQLANPQSGTVVANDDFGAAQCVVVDPARVDCSAAACACGHAALMPEFHALGFKLVVPLTGTFALSAQPFFDGHIGWEAVREFFGLEPEWADHLFDSCTYDHEPEIQAGGQITPAMVAKRIRNLVHDERISRQMGLPGAQ